MYLVCGSLSKKKLLRATHKIRSKKEKVEPKWTDHVLLVKLHINSKYSSLLNQMVLEGTGSWGEGEKEGIHIHISTAVALKK